MILKPRFGIFASVLLLGPVVASPVAATTLDEKIKSLEQSISAQQARIFEQEKRLQELTGIINSQKAALEHQRHNMEVLSHEVMRETRGTGDGTADTGSDQVVERPFKQSQPQNPVGQAPVKTSQTKPQIEAIADIGGVLTRKGQLIIEPTLEYAHSDVNRLTFRGIEILSSLGIGILEAVDADRDAVIASITGRLGLTNRLELELKVPYVYRDDDETAVIPQLNTDPSAETNKSLQGDGIGDIEAALHYQLNRGGDGWPYFIANARLKLANADGPFDIDRTADGIGRELAIGSGFYSFEPSITALFPTAPAVFFANVGYQFNIEDDVNTTIGSTDTGSQTIGDVDPGDAIRLSFGMAYSVNERTSFTLGFKNDWIEETDTEINGVTVSSSTLNIGSMLLGYSYQLKPELGVNLNLEFGITDDAPDMLMTLRVPFQAFELW